MDNKNLRYGVIVIILIAFGGGIWTRYRLATASESPFSDEIGPGLESFGIRTTGSFKEQITGMAGFEVSLPSCAQAAAVLPVPAWSSVIIPTAFRYHQGDYKVSYVYNGRTYPEERINYKLRLLSILYRTESLLVLNNNVQTAFYLKIWSPPACPELSTSEALSLERYLTPPYKLREGRT
jgi:hypothetical protein